MRGNDFNEGDGSMQLGIYVPSQPWNEAGIALREMIREESVGEIHTDTMRLRIETE